MTAEAHDDAAWGKPIRVQRATPASLSLPADLAARAAFLAQLHRTKSVEEWLTQVIQERVDLEEAAFVGVKRRIGLRTPPDFDGWPAVGLIANPAPPLRTLGEPQWAEALAQRRAGEDERNPRSSVGYESKSHGCTPRN